MIAETFRVSHSQRTNQSFVLLVMSGRSSLWLLIGARGDIHHAELYAVMLGVSLNSCPIGRKAFSAVNYSFCCQKCHPVLLNRSASCIPFLSTSAVLEGIFQQLLPALITMKTTLLGNIMLAENAIYLELG